MTINFANKVALITGASSGIGNATAERMGRAACQLMLTGRKPEALEEIKATIETSGGTCEICCGDITDPDFRSELINRTIATYSNLDILVNSAGVIASGSLENTSLDDFDAMMDINLRSVFHLMQLALPHLRKNSGNVVNVSSVTGTRAFPGILAYCVSKAGLDQLTRAASLELAPEGVRVNAVNPGVVVSNLHRRSGMDEEKYLAFLEHSRSTHPIGRVGQAEEIADLIIFLASEHAGWITGTTVNIDGGRHLTCAR